MKRVSAGSRSSSGAACWCTKSLVPGRTPHIQQSCVWWWSWIKYHVHVVLLSVTNKFASCARRVPLQRRRSVCAWCPWSSPTAQSAWSVSCKDLLELSLPCDRPRVEMFSEQALTADWLCFMHGGYVTHSAATHSQTDSHILQECNNHFILCRQGRIAEVCERWPMTPCYPYHK